MALRCLVCLHGGETISSSVYPDVAMVDGCTLCRLHLKEFVASRETRALAFIRGLLDETTANADIPAESSEEPSKPKKAKRTRRRRK